MFVLDASILVAYFTRHDQQQRVKQVLGSELRGHGPEMYAPGLVDLEVLHALRRQVRHRDLSPDRAARAVHYLRRARITRLEHTPLVPRIWALRDNVSAYDAAYVAVAEVLGATLLTFDRRLAASTGHRATIVVP